MTRRTVLVHVTRVVLLAASLAAWQLGVEHGVLDKFVVSSPQAIWDQLRAWFSGSSIWTALWTTLRELLLGYAFGLIVGVSVGIAIGVSATMRAYCEPFLVFFNSVPRLILTPIFIVIFGFGLLPKILTVFAVIVIVIILTVSTSIQEIRGQLISNARMLGATRLGLLRQVYLPGVSIWILASARVAISLAFQAAIVAEFFGSAEGLGHLIQLNQTTLNATAMYAAILLAGAMAFLLDLVLMRVQRRTSAWMP
jgi:ABC-type nitrate/sulfonate/bicarbonate transport system permease component